MIPMTTSLSPACTHNGVPPCPRLPKLCGADFELGNLVLGVELPKGTGALASHLLLREFNGLPLARKSQSVCYCSACTARRRALEDGYTIAEFLGEECSMAKNGSLYNAQDWARKFLNNGGCAYIDLDHLELCIPEVLSAHDHVAASHAMLRKARLALQTANARLPEGKKIVVLANNSDGQGHSYGSHLNFLLTRRAWSDLFERRLQHLLFLAAYQASSIVFTGQGKIGAENNRPATQYQISQRADFFEILMGPQTTFNRPLINSRDEALCGPWYGANASSDSIAKARLHVIFYDQTLCHTASLLKVGVMQIILAMIEAGSVCTSLVLDDPVEAVWQWSHDPTMHCQVRLADGRNLTAVELQMLFWEEAQRFVAKGGCSDIVPDAPQILELWSDTLSELRARNYPALARRLDWVLKLQILQRARQQRPNLTWSSAELKHLDFMYASLEDGLYWNFEKGGLVNTLIADEQIERFRHEPPENTRAWTRARLLGLAEPQQIERVDWDSITFSLKGDHYWPRESTVHLTNPLGFTRTACQRVFQLSTTLEEASAMLSANQDGTTAISPTNAAVQEPIQIEGDHHESTRTPPA
jgi:proteasome accessory factor A